MPISPEVKNNHVIYHAYNQHNVIIITHKWLWHHQLYELPGLEALASFLYTNDGISWNQAASSCFTASSLVDAGVTTHLKPSHQHNIQTLSVVFRTSRIFENDSTSAQDSQKRTFTLHSDKCLEKKTLNRFTQLAVISDIKQISFPPASKNRQRCGRSDVLGKLVPDRGNHDDKSVVANWRTSSSWDD